MKAYLIPLSIGLLLCSSSCGGRDSSAADDSTPDVDAASPNAEDAPIELTDALMEQYVEIIKEAKAAGNQGPLGFLARHGWSLERWTKVSGAVAQGIMSAARSQFADAAANATKEVDGQIRDAEKRLATAKGDEKTAVEAQLEALKSLKAMQAESQVNVTDLDRKNAAVLERWRPRIEAIGQEK